MNYDILKEHWLIACSSKTLGTKPYACEILSTPIVLFRNQEKITALLDRCPHRNAPLSRGKIINGGLECPYHGWQFDTNGECQKIPGLCNKVTAKSRDATRFEVIECQGFVWIKLSASTHEIYQPPLLENKNYHSFIWQAEVSASLVNILENFLDGTHTHFVHSGLIRREGERQEVRAAITRGSDRVERRYTGEGKQSGFISKWFERSRRESYGRFILPSVAEIEYCSDSGSELTITAYITSTSDAHHKIYAVISIKQGIIPGVIKQWLLTPFFRKALKQDIEILELQQKTIEQFGKETFISTETDLIRPHIESLLHGNNKKIEKTITVML